MFIGYAAKVTWGPFRLSYGARLTMPSGSPLSQKQSLSFGQLREEQDGVNWHHDALDVHATWTGGSSIPSVCVVDQESGSIEWACLVANSAAQIHANGWAISGTGYVERLTMTIPPWKLPFTQLRWGRYISEDRSDYAVWIALQGETERSWVWVNSPLAVAGAVDDKEVRTDDMVLTLESSNPIRSENVAHSLLGRLVLLVKFLPRAVWNIEEDKQVGSARLRTANHESRGSSIHEVVTWR